MEKTGVRKEFKLFREMIGMIRQWTDATLEVSAAEFHVDSGSEIQRVYIPIGNYTYIIRVQVPVEDHPYGLGLQPYMSLVSTHTDGGGNDMTDGNLSWETFHKMMADIVGHAYAVTADGR